MYTQRLLFLEWSLYILVVGITFFLLWFQRPGRFVERCFYFHGKLFEPNRKADRAIWFWGWISLPVLTLAGIGVFPKLYAFLVLGVPILIEVFARRFAQEALCQLPAFHLERDRNAIECPGCGDRTYYAAYCSSCGYKPRGISASLLVVGVLSIGLGVCLEVPPIFWKFLVGVGGGITVLAAFFLMPSASPHFRDRSGDTRGEVESKE